MLTKYEEIKMNTEFGKWLKTLRISLGIKLYDMSVTMGISPAFISSIETGKKNIPVDFVDRIKKYYALTEEQDKSLQEAVKLTREEELKKKKSVQIKVNTSSSDVQNLVYSFARQANSLTEEQKAEINKILQRGEGFDD